MMCLHGLDIGSPRVLLACVACLCGLIVVLRSYKVNLFYLLTMRCSLQFHLHCLPARILQRKKRNRLSEMMQGVVTARLYYLCHKGQ